MFPNLNQPYWPLRPAPNNVEYPGFGTISYYTFEANSTYNTGTATLRRRFTRGLFYTFNYQYGKSIDEGNSQLAGMSGGGINGPQNVHCFKCDRGRSDWDIPHTFTMSFSALSPFHRNVLLRGWQLAGSGRLYTGAPFTLNLASVSAGQPNRPNRIAKGTVSDPGVNGWFDVSAFPPVPAQSYLFGNSGRNILDGPGRIETNLNLSKNFAVREQTNLQVRWEVFNILNHANFGLPVRSVDVSNAATLTSADNGRLMQFGLRYSF